MRLLTLTTGRELRLRTALKDIREQFDVILIDCPPSLESADRQCVGRRDSVLIPMQCEYYALEGLSSLLATVGADP